LGLSVYLIENTCLDYEDRLGERSETHLGLHVYGCFCLILTKFGPWQIWVKCWK